MYGMFVAIAIPIMNRRTRSGDLLPDSDGPAGFDLDASLYIAHPKV